MAAPTPPIALRSTDFPKGLVDKASLDQLFQILNPIIASVQAVTASGTSLNQNVDGQSATVSVTTPATGSAFPVTVRIKDGKKPQFVLARAINKSNQQASMVPVAFTYLGTSKVGNQVRLDDVPGLDASTQYDISLFIFF